MCSAYVASRSWIACAQALVDEGKVKFLGLSEVAPADVRRAHAIHPITLVEMCVPDLHLNHLCICT